MPRQVLAQPPRLPREQKLGGDDGWLLFKVDCYQVIASSGTTQTIAQGDLIPNFGLPAGLVR